VGLKLFVYLLIGDGCFWGSFEMKVLTHYSCCSGGLFERKDYLHIKVAVWVPFESIEG